MKKRFGLNKILGLLLFSSMILLFSTSVSCAYPQFHNQSFSVANETQYRNPQRNYGFEINVTDDAAVGWEIGNITGVKLLINVTGIAVNYTAVNMSANGVYTYNFTALGKGAYNFSWYAYNTTGFGNSSLQQIYVIAINATNPLHLNMNGNVDANNTITYMDWATITAYADYSNSGTVLLYRGGSDVSSENGVAIRVPTAPDGHNYSAITTGNNNFTSNMTTWYLIVVEQPTQSGGGGRVTAPIYCTEDVKQCEDGTYVTRDPNNGCQFMACPTYPSVENQPETTVPQSGGGFNLGGIFAQIQTAIQSFIAQIMAWFGR